MGNDLSLKILESYVEIDKINEDINNNIFNFITKANELVELSEDDYQIEKTLNLNKISLKGFILDSSCCVRLDDNNITDYSIQELKNYLIQYEKNFSEDYSKYYLAVSLYELVDHIEELVNSKIDLEIKELNEFVPNVGNIKNVNKSNYEGLYFNSKNQLDNYLKNKKIDKKIYNICIRILNDIFNFYISGYPTIADVSDF